MMKKGIVMEVKRRHLILLTGEGEFCRVKKPAEQVGVGDEVVSSELTIRSYNQLIATGAMAAILMIAFVILQPFLNQKTYAHVSIDINPSFEIELNKNNEAVMLEPVNDDAHAIFENLNWENKPVANVIASIVQESIRAGFLASEDGTVTISTAVSEEADSAFEKELQSVIKSWSQTSNVSHISFLKGDMQDVIRADERGISFGQLLAEQKSENEQLITPEKPASIIEQKVEQVETVEEPVDIPEEVPAPPDTVPAEETSEEIEPANSQGMSKKEENLQNQELKKAEQQEKKEEKQEEKEESKNKNNVNEGNNGNSGNNENGGNNSNNGNNGNNGNSGNNGNNGNGGKNSNNGNNGNGNNNGNGKNNGN